MKIKKIEELTEDELALRMYVLSPLFEQQSEEFNKRKFMWNQWHVLADTLHDLRVKRGDLRLRMGGNIKNRNKTDGSQ